MFKRWIKAFAFDEGAYKEAENANIIELLIMFCLTLIVSSFLQYSILINAELIDFFAILVSKLFIYFIYGISFFIFSKIIKPSLSFKTMIRSVLFVSAVYPFLSSLYLGLEHIIKKILLLDSNLFIESFSIGIVLLLELMLFLSWLYYFRINETKIRERRIVVYMALTFFIFDFIKFILVFFIV